MSPKFSIFQIWRHKLPSGEYSKSFVSKQLYSKLKVAQKNVQKWTKTLFFKHEPAHKTGKMTSLERRHISVENYFQTAALWFSDSSLNFDEEKSIVEK